MTCITDINRLKNSIRNKNLVQCVVEQNYIVKKDYISKWFSVQEVSKEVLDCEFKVTFNKGELVKCEELKHMNLSDGSITTFLDTVELLGKEFVKIGRNINGVEEKGELVPHNDFFCIHKPNEVFELKCNNKINRWYFDSNGLEYKMEILDQNGRMEEVTQYFYDNRGLKDRAVTIRSNMRYTHTYQYDAQGNRTFSEWYDDNGTRKQEIDQYNQYNDIIIQDSWWGGKRIKKEFEYNYDEYGNWLECREMNDGIYVKLSIRQFKYLNH